MRKTIAFTILVLLSISLAGSIMVTASASTYPSRQYCDGYYYDLDTNSPSNVPLGSTVTVNAMTNDPRGCKVTFYWASPSGQVTPITAQLEGSENDGEKTASSSLILNEAGQWKVVAVFWDKLNVKCFEFKFPVAIRCQQFFVLPEASILGVAGTSALALVLYKVKARKQ